MYLAEGELRLAAEWLLRAWSQGGGGSPATAAPAIAALARAGDCPAAARLKRAYEAAQQEGSPTLRGLDSLLAPVARNCEGLAPAPR